MSGTGRFLWLCPLLSLGLVAVTGLLFGFSLRTAVLSVILLGCPIAALWAYFGGRLSRSRRGSVGPGLPGSGRS
jgi:hypothetical protein